MKTKAAERNIPLPVCLAECLKAAKETSTSEYVVSNRDGEPLSYTQFKRLWQYIVTRTVKERSYEENDDLSEIAAFEPAFVVRQSEFHNFVSGSERDAGSFR